MCLFLNVILRRGLFFNLFVTSIQKEMSLTLRFKIVMIIFFEIIFTKTVSSITSRGEHVNRIVVTTTAAFQSRGGIALHSVTVVECTNRTDDLANVHTYVMRNRAREQLLPRHPDVDFLVDSNHLCVPLKYSVTMKRSFSAACVPLARQFSETSCSFVASNQQERLLAIVSLNTSIEICSVSLVTSANRMFPSPSLTSNAPHHAGDLLLTLDENDKGVVDNNVSYTHVALVFDLRKRFFSTQQIFNGPCTVKCTNVGNCNNHATSVTGTVDDTCFCDCKSGWTGETCDISTTPTAPPTPAPPAQCTNANCNNHATSWSGIVGSCSCTCDPAWTDGTCSTSNVCTNADCSGNADGVSGNRPSCACTCNAAWTGSTCAASNLCTNAADCNSHATIVSGNRPNCACSCSAEWTGAACATSNACTTTADCSGNAASVTGNRPSCTCSCNAAWTGSTCALSNMCTASDCNNHATSFSGNRPSCTCACPGEWIGSTCETSNVCATSDDCSGHATTVSGNRPSCTCTCSPEWIGTKCEISNVCTNPVDCSGQATSVSGNRPSCSCTCAPEWTGTSCQTSNVCTNDPDCTNHATSVSGNRPSCTCFCPAEWVGSACQTSNVCTNSADCSNHATSFSGNRPSCSCSCPPEWIGSACEISNVCTIAEDCSDHGTTVSGNRPSCTCTCPGEWIGAKCETSNVCTNAVDCNFRAGRVVGNRPACTCHCLAAYHGKTCDVTYTLTPTTSHSHKPTYTRSDVDLSVSRTSSESWTRSTSLTQRVSKSVISDSPSKTDSLQVSITTTPSYSNRTTVSSSPTKTSTFIFTTSVTRSSSTSRSLTQASQSMRATTTEMRSATRPSVSVTLSFRETRDGNFFLVNGNDDPNGPQNHLLGGASVSLSRSWTYVGNLSITASLRKSPTVTVSPSCTSNVQLAIRALQELLSTEAELWCGGTAVGGVSSVGNGVNVSDNVVSESNTTLMPASCVVAPSASHGSITAQISRTTMASMVPPLKLIIPFTLNATDWDVERYTTATPTVDAATLNISALSVQWEYSLLTSASAVSNVTVNDSVATTIVLGNTIGAVEYRLDAIPAYSTVHAVVLRCQCGGRPVTTVFTVQWPDKVVLMTPAQEVLAGLATPLGPLSGDPTAAASMALMGAMSCSGEPITSASVAAYFISVFVDFGPASLALGNLGLAAAFCLLHAAAGAVYYRAVMKSDVTESLDSSTASTSDDHGNNGCDHEELKVAWWVQLCGAVRGPAWSVLFVQFMLPGAVYGSLVCLSSGDSIGLGALALFFVILVFVAHYLALTRLVLPNAVYVEYAIPQPTGSWLEVTLKMLPESKWLSYPLVRGFGPLMASRCREYCVMTFSDLFLSCLLAVATGLGVGTKGSSCSYAPLIVAVVYFLYAAALVVKRPHRIPTDKLLAPMISTTYGVMCVLKYTESDGGACGTLLSVLQITQMILRMWVMFREQQWQRIEQEEEEERERIRLSLLMLEGDECTGKDELHVNDLLCARASDGSGNDGSGSDMGGALVDIRDSGTAAANDETSAAAVEVLFWDENGVAVGMNGTSVVSDDDTTRHGDANESFDGELIMTNHEKMMREQQQHQQNSAVVYGTVFDRRLRLDAQQKKQGKRGKSSMFSLSSYL